MKKIVGLLAAAAVLATSVFAADVSAKVRVTGEIFNLDNTVVNEKNEAASAFKLFRAATVSHAWDAPYATLSTSTDNAGASVNFTTGDDGTTDLGVSNVNVWFKPIDVLKIQAGHHDLAMNKETIDWTSTNGYGTFGYSLGFAQDAISVDVCLGTDNNEWFFKDAQAKWGSKEEPYSAYIRDLYAKFGYSADFGTISAMFEYKGKNWDANSCNPDTIKFGAGYKNTFDALTIFADVVGTSYSAWSDKEGDTIKAQATGTDESKFVAFTDKDDKFRSAFGLAIDAFAQYSADALTVKGYVLANIKDFGHLTVKDGEKKADLMADNNFELGLKARVDYKLDNGIGIYGYFGSGNLLRKETKAGDTDPSSVFAATIKAGATGNVGIATWETWLEISTGNSVGKLNNVAGKDAGKYDKVNVKMPVYIQVAF